MGVKCLIHIAFDHIIQQFWHMFSYSKMKMLSIKCRQKMTIEYFTNVFFSLAACFCSLVRIQFYIHTHANTRFLTLKCLFCCYLSSCIADYWIEVSFGKAGHCKVPLAKWKNTITITQKRQIHKGSLDVCTRVCVYVM